MFAGLLTLVYRNRGLVYGEHPVSALHLHTFWLLAVCALMATVLVIAIPVYALLAMRRVYRGRWWPLLLRCAFLSLIYAVILLAMFLVVTEIAVLA